MSPAPTGVLLVNTGSPDSPSVPDVRRYLRQFLSDPRILDMPGPARWALLNLVILPRRPRHSAAAYRSIWTEEGSPLVAHTRHLAEGLAGALGEGFEVAAAMRYGAPCLAEALAALRARGCEHVVFAPLFPQYAEATSGSAIAEGERLASQLGLAPLRVLAPFYDDPGFVAAFAAAGRAPVAQDPEAAVLFSFHGLPERQIRKADPGGACLAGPDCCQPLRAENRHCYRAQCFETARLVAEALALPPARWSVAFQSRMGRIPWIGPHTEERLAQMAAGGVRRVVLFAPSFVADCLETLEELAVRAAEQFRAAGGESLQLVPSLNARPEWVTALAGLVRRTATGEGAS